VGSHPSSSIDPEEALGRNPVILNTNGCFTVAELLKFIETSKLKPDAQVWIGQDDLTSPLQEMSHNGVRDVVFLTRKSEAVTGPGPVRDRSDHGWEQRGDGKTTCYFCGSISCREGCVK